MSSATFPSLAVIADAHFHDLYGDYDFAGVAAGGRRMTARRLTDTVRSTRVFNESYFALRTALDDVVSRSIKHVVLLGDYSDDGQVSTLKALRQLLDGYTQAHGLIFTAVPGNHDIFGPKGRHHAKRLLNPDGSYTIVASDSAFIDEDADGMVVTDKMYCQGYPEGLQALPDFGFFRRVTDIHWETPFGLDDNPAGRLYPIRSADGTNEYQLMDTSYLVEPIPGLWLLMIDANVFVPRDGDFERGDSGAFIDSTNAGWNTMLHHKRFVIDWIKSVSARAEIEGKHLLTFSHYPMLDILDDTHADEKQLIGNTSSVKRTPLPDVAAAMMQAGVRIHFSGHLHVNDTARAEKGASWLVNVGVPSLVAFPPAFKVITFMEQSLHIETISIDDQPIDPVLNDQYRTEIKLTGKNVGNMLDAVDYGAFISEHVDQLVVHRYLRREWPKDIARILPLLTLGDLLTLSLFEQPVDMDATIILVHAERGRPETKAKIQALLASEDIGLEHFDRMTALELLGDWYRLRMASEMALDRISAARQEIYRALIAVFAGSNAIQIGGAQAHFALMLQMMGRYFSGLPSRNFRIDLASGRIDKI
ncbi:metallophosphoesterase family protein [Phyllobacterium myrsinacearum]|uniref:3',5'-cyclic AMP phosphodiesterase CpdA n=1 Tax=Phyllobacterium myrsinacearum TaxID=28101 RepID=A0A839EM96_9HYPH|nr:metallophosphoesterase [Phyllobacterium myrsinacearum]MBA8879398.1 3',5'-cyclic AMP phosphodiesterase CpdA [Phyllobacterium myrsinacearum]